ARKHPCGIFFRALKRIETGRVRKRPWHVLLEDPAEQISPGLIFWKGYLRNIGMGKRLAMGGYFNILPPYLKTIDWIFVPLHRIFPIQDRLPMVRIQFHFQSFEFTAQKG